MTSQYIISVFDDEGALLKALKRLKKEKITIEEIFTPFPIHEAFDAIGRKSNFTIAAFLFGFAGALSVLAFLQYTAVYDWPINYGGKPTNAFPSFIIVTIVLTILITTLASLFTFSARARIYPGKSFVLPDLRAMDDKFIIVLRNSGALPAMSDLDKMLREEGATEIYQKDLQPLI